MLKYGTQTGSLINHVLSQESCVPQIGMGATILSWTDRHPATVIGWDEKKMIVTIQADKYTRVDQNGMSDCQDYEFTADPTGPIYHYRWRDKKGWIEIFRNKETGRWVQSTRGGLTVGRRERYYDFSF